MKAKKLTRRVFALWMAVIMVLAFMPAIASAEPVSDGLEFSSKGGSPTKAITTEI